MRIGCNLELNRDFAPCFLFLFSFDKVKDRQITITYPAYEFYKSNCISYQIRHIKSSYVISAQALIYKSFSYLE